MEEERTGNPVFDNWQPRIFGGGPARPEEDLPILQSSRPFPGSPAQFAACIVMGFRPEADVCATVASREYLTDNGANAVELELRRRGWRIATITAFTAPGGSAFKLDLNHVMPSDRERVEGYWAGLLDFLGLEESATVKEAAAFGEMLTRTDYRIVCEIQDNPRATAQDVAGKLRLPVDEVGARIQFLEAEGITEALDERAMAVWDMRLRSPGMSAKDIADRLSIRIAGCSEKSVGRSLKTLARYKVAVALRRESPATE